MNREVITQQLIEDAGRLQRPVDMDAIKKIGLSHAQASMLFMLHHRPGVTMSELAQHLGITKSAVTQVLDPLIEKRLIERRVIPTDKRVAQLYITTHGRDILKRLRKHKIENFRSSLEVLNETEIKQLASIFQKLTTNIKGHNLDKPTA